MPEPQPGTELVRQLHELLQRCGWGTGIAAHELGALAPEVLACVRGWQAVETGRAADAEAEFAALEGVAALHGWILLARAFIAGRAKHYESALALLSDVEKLAGDDQVLRASLLHQRGTIHFHQGLPHEVISPMEQALSLLGEGHFFRGRILDTLGMIYAARDNFHGAQQFFDAAIKVKVYVGDQAGLAVTHGQLGRLYLDWERLEAAEHHFRQDLQISQKIGDQLGVSQMYNGLGRVAVARGDRDAARGQATEAEEAWCQAEEHLAEAVRRTQGSNPVRRGYAHKDFALALVRRQRWDHAAAEATTAETLFQQADFAEGLAHVRRVWGILYRERGETAKALDALQKSLVYFQSVQEQVEEVRTSLELARCRLAAGEPRPLVRDAFLAALATAEACRRDGLVRQIDRELRAADPEAYFLQVYHRVRGRNVRDDTTSLLRADLETVSAFYLDLKGSTDFARQHDPEEVMLVINQMLAELTTAVHRHDGQISGYRGDGFLALFRGDDPAGRAVAAGLEVARTMRDFNRPRLILGLKPFETRIGIATGAVVLGNMGTYDKMDFTAVGNAANLGARLEGQAEQGFPCVCGETHARVADRYRFRAGNPRRQVLKGFGEQELWDVEAAIAHCIQV